jgi:hypothetical protein
VEEKGNMIAAINSNDLSALSNILYFYKRYLGRVVAPSTKRTRQVTEVQILLTKVQLLASAKAAVLTFDEVDHIDNAIKIFTSQVKNKIPQSKNRDDILESCEGLREYIVKAFAVPE